MNETTAINYAFTLKNYRSEWQWPFDEEIMQGRGFEIRKYKRSMETSREYYDRIMSDYREGRGRRVLR